MILVTMLLLPFRVALVSAVAIPVTISATFGLLNAFGIELHQVSIAALIVVLGMVVDDAIVIADNYIELLDQGVPRPEAAWRSASELAIPVLTATLTIICSFLPFLILSGATGEFIRALPLTVAIALSTSFIVGMLLTPMLSQFFIKQGLHHAEAAAAKKRRSPLEIMQAIYNRVIVVAMKWKTAAVVFGVFAVAAGAFVLHHLPERFFPFAERDQFVIDVWLPEGWKVEATQAAVNAHRGRAASGEGGGQLHLVHRVELSALLLQRQSAVAGQELRPVAGLDQVGGSHAEAGQSAAPAARAGGSGSPRLPERVATGSGPVGGHRSPAYRRRRARIAALGRSGAATAPAHAGIAGRAQRLARGCLPHESESPRRRWPTVWASPTPPSGRCWRAASKASRSPRIGKASAISPSPCGWNRRGARPSTMSPIPT